MELQLRNVQSDAQKGIQDWIQTFDEEDKESISRNAQDEYQSVFSDTYPLYLRYSFVVLIYLVLESQLNALCDDIKERKGIPIRATELRGDSNITRCKIYLQKLANLSNIDDKYWETVEDISKVRNCIVHTLGKVELSRDRKRLHEIATENRGLSISNIDLSEQEVLVITPEYCQQAVRDVLMLLQKIFEAAGYEPVADMYMIAFRDFDETADDE